MDEIELGENPFAIWLDISVPEKREDGFNRNISNSMVDNNNAFVYNK